MSRGARVSPCIGLNFVDMQYKAVEPVTRVVSFGKPIGAHVPCMFHSSHRQAPKFRILVKTVPKSRISGNSEFPCNHGPYCTVGPKSPDQDICIAGDGKVHCNLRPSQLIESARYCLLRDQV